MKAKNKTFVNPVKKRKGAKISDGYIFKRGKSYTISLGFKNKNGKKNGITISINTKTFEVDAESIVYLVGAFEDYAE